MVFGHAATDDQVPAMRSVNNTLNSETKLVGQELSRVSGRDELLLKPASDLQETLLIESQKEIPR